MSAVTNMGSYQDPSFYSNWKEEEIRDVNWDNLPTTRILKWHEVTKVRNAVSQVLLGFAIATSAAIFFTAVPIVCASLFISSLALFVTSIYLYVQEDNPLDPHFRMKERDDIKESVESSQIPAIGMLNALVERFIITEEEKQALLHQEIYDTDYEIFVKKHGQTIFDELDSQNLSLLKLKFLAYLSECEVKDLTDIQAILNSRANDYFQLTEDDLVQFLAIEDSSEELSEKEESDQSTFAQEATSQVSAYVAPAFKLAIKLLVPSSLKVAGQCAMASAQLAKQGKIKASAVYAMNAITCLFIHSTKEMMKVLYPEAFAIVKQQMLYEKALNAGYAS